MGWCNHEGGVAVWCGRHTRGLVCNCDVVSLITMSSRCAESEFTKNIEFELVLVSQLYALSKFDYVKC